MLDQHSNPSKAVEGKRGHVNLMHRYAQLNTVVCLIPSFCDILEIIDAKAMMLVAAAQARSAKMRPGVPT